jgi:putative component of toxin-antitoxin plasmid stabilization module
MRIGLWKTDIEHDPSHKRRILAMTKQAADDATVRCAYEEYITSKKIRSNRAARKKIRRMLKNVAQYGEEYYDAGTERMRPVGKGVSELKPGAHRLLMFRYDDWWIITDAFKKPPKRVQDEKIEAAHKDRARFMRLKDQ